MKNRKSNKKIYSGEIGQLWEVSYVPKFMINWPIYLAKTGCFILNHLPHRLSYKIERFLNRNV